MWNAWLITSDDRVQHDVQFQFLKPINGYITGEQARAFFLQSKLPNNMLAQVWSLADMDADGKLTKQEFSIAMFLIKKCLEGNTLPPMLPGNLKQDPQLSFPKSLIGVPSVMSTTSSSFPALPGNSVNSNGSASIIDTGDWSISMTSRPRYRLQFNQNDRNKRGYLTGVEARGIFLRSGLPQSILAQIWNLADVDRDGSLTCDEFCIAAYLVEQAQCGRMLPTALPNSLYPSNQKQHKNSISGLVGTTLISDGAATNNDQPQTFEDKRMKNFLMGQAELERRKQDLEEQQKQEEAARAAQAQREFERQEKIRLEKEKQRLVEAERQAERQRQAELKREARRNQAATTRLNAFREAQREKQLEAEKFRVEALKKERAQDLAALDQAKAHRDSLLESAGSQNTRRNELDTKVKEAEAEVEVHKAAISEMRCRRDNYDREVREFTERVEAAKAELACCQREHEQLSMRTANNVAASQVSEQQKTLDANRHSRNLSIHQLKIQLTELDEGITKQGQALATQRNQAQGLEKKSKQIILELNKLRSDVKEKVESYRNKKLSSAFDLSELKIGGAKRYSGPRQNFVANYAFVARHTDEVSLTVGDKVLVSILRVHS